MSFLVSRVLVTCLSTPACVVKHRHSKKGEPPFDYYGTLVEDLSSLSSTRPDLLLKFLLRKKVSAVPIQRSALLNPRIFINKDAFWTAGAPNFGVDEKFWNSRADGRVHSETLSQRPCNLYLLITD